MEVVVLVKYFVGKLAQGCKNNLSHIYLLCVLKTWFFLGRLKLLAMVHEGVCDVWREASVRERCYGHCFRNCSNSSHLIRGLVPAYLRVAGNQARCHSYF